MVASGKGEEGGGSLGMEEDKLKGKLNVIKGKGIRKEKGPWRVWQ